MQAQSPLAPYIGLWTRLDPFGPEKLANAVTEGRAVRTSLMRSTLHLVSARDALLLRPLIRPVLERGWASSPFATLVAGINKDELLEAGRRLLEEEPRTIAALGKLLQARWPDRDANGLAYTVRYLLPVVQLPPRGVWGGRGQATWTTLEAWLGRPVAEGMQPEEMVLRYLAAFGPASVMDIQAWCWLTRLRAVVEPMRPQLRVFRDETGRELFDLPEGQLPNPETPAPARFLPEYDNALLSHADRSRITSRGYGERAFARGSFLVDGFVRGAWKIARRPGHATLEVELFERLAAGDRVEVETEGTRLLDFAAADAEARDVRFTGSG
ncbi:MAG: winged helix DNA-binding domain-containing protein [Chloroflexota bacterium]|nr:winged helix DNA-binding domain-containing protein [Chloroflexota bacterium]